MNLRDFNTAIGSTDNVMCCCRKDLEHLNTIKYTLKYKEHFRITNQYFYGIKNQEYLDNE